jgi:hypothetical protein
MGEIWAWDTSDRASPDPLPLDWYLAARDEGVQMIVHRVGNGQRFDAIGRRGIENCLRAGLAAAAYVIWYEGQDGWNTVALTHAHLHDVWDQLAFIGIDVEVAGQTAQQAIHACELVEFLGGFAAIYTAPYIWRDHLGNPDASRFALWNAWTTEEPGIRDFPSYGGWARASTIGQQWSWKRRFRGVPVDDNTFEDRILTWRENKSSG